MSSSTEWIRHIKKSSLLNFLCANTSLGADVYAYIPACVRVRVWFYVSDFFVWVCLTLCLCLCLCAGCFTIVEKNSIVLPAQNSSRSVRTLMRRNRGSIRMMLLLTLLMLRWHGSVKCFGDRLIRRKVKLEWITHSSEPNAPGGTSRTTYTRAILAPLRAANT